MPRLVCTACVKRGADVRLRGDREIVTAVGGAHPSWSRHDGPDTVTMHQSLDVTAARPTALDSQFGMDARAAVAAFCVAINPLDVVDELTVGNGPLALRARPPGVGMVASFRDIAERKSHQV
jgi:hypothetical protein